MKRLYILGILFLISIASFAQSGKITGKVINSGSGQALSNATLTLIEKSKIAIADQNGVFTFSKLEAGTYSIKCTYGGHADKIVDGIIVKSDDNTQITISLEEIKSDAVILKSAPRTRAAGESVASLLIAQKNSASVSDGITAEQIKKTPDRSTSDVLKRVSGASIQDDRFAIIRGLNDRYNAAFINGSPLPSTESDRKAFAFDIFPSAILDNLVIYKTATADKSGDFAGGIIDITTKSVPAKNFTSISYSIGVNSLITGKTRYFSENEGKKDWIGLDDGRRALPTGIPATLEFPSDFAQRANLAKLFGNYKWGVKKANTRPNFNFQLVKGFNIQLKEKEFLGAVFSVTYNRAYSFNDGDRDVYTPDANGTLIQVVEIRDSVYNDEVVVAALGNISVKIDNRNSIVWKNNLSINTDNKLIKRLAAMDIQNQPTAGFNDLVRVFTSNKIASSQLIGEHLFGSKKTKVNWLGAYTKVIREIPNYSRTSYIVDITSPSVGSAFFSGGNPSQLFGSGSMFFVNSDEDIKSIKTDITQPYTFMKNSQNFIKIGGGYQIRERNFTSRLLGFAEYSGGAIQYDNSLNELPADQIFLPQHLGLMKNGKGGFMLGDANTPNSNYDASSTTTHAYIMNDQRFFKKSRFIYGVRLESFNQKINSPSGFSNIPDITVDSTVTDILPSVNFVYALTPKMNVRFSYSQTVNRPEFREIAPFLFYDYQAQYSINGNTKLLRAKIKNYDFRYEFFPGNAQLFSVSAFYKDFLNPIEISFIPTIAQQAAYGNAVSGEVYGLEAEFRTLVSTLLGIKRENSFLSKFTLSANAAYIKSDVVLPSVSGGAGGIAGNRPMQGQSPYLINGSAAYNDEKSGFSATLSANRVGDRLSVAGSATPSIFEKARTVLDFQLSKLFLKNMLELKFTAKDILVQDISFYFDNDKNNKYSTGKDSYFSIYKAPNLFSFSATYKF